MKATHVALMGGLLLFAGANAAANAATNPDKAWIKLDQDAYGILKQVDPAAHELRSSYINNGLTMNGQPITDKLHVVEVDPGVLGALSVQIHRQLHHCAGYVRYDSRQAALDSLQPLQSLATFTRPSYQITHQDLVGPMINQQEASHIGQTIQDLSSFRNRYFNGQHGADASDWMLQKWQDMSASRSDISVEQVRRGNDMMPSVVLTIQGTEHPDQVVVMGGHLDSINQNDRNGQSQANARAPGADDDASGVASVTEALRVMIDAGYKPQRTIKLMAYAGEEEGLLGSAYIAKQFYNQGVDVVGVLQLDMTDYKGSAGDIYLEDDYTDAQQNQFIENLASTYLPSLDVRHDTCGYACSDHASWNQYGYPASMPFEALLSQSNPYIHSSRDTWENVGSQATNALKFSRLALAFAVELGDVAGDSGDDGNGGDDGDDNGNDHVLKNGVPVMVSGSKSQFSEAYQVNLPEGASNLVITESGGSGDADLYTRFGAVPTTHTYDCRPWEDGNEESCSVPSPQAGTTYAALHGYQNYANVRLVATWDVPGDGNGDGSGDDGSDHVFNNDTDMDIPDSGTATSHISVSGVSGNGSGALKVGVHIVHSYRGDLRVTLIAPDGSSQVLKEPDYYDNSADVDATYTVDASDVSANGEWTLRVDDAYSNYSGYLDAWSLAF